MTKLLTSHNYKLQKSRDYGWMTVGLQLSPATEYRDATGTDAPTLCAGAGQCAEVCLSKTGLNTPSSSMQARLNRTNQYVHDYDNFVARLGDEIAQARNTARRQNLQLAVRPNMLSDQPKLAWDLARRLPDVQFYDYTKLKTVLTVGQPSNYHLTFSASEKSSPQFCADLLRGKIANVAIVFNVARGDALPYTHTLDGEVFPVIDGDLHDLRFLDPPGVIVGLRFKGGARAQTLATNGGFIRLTQVQDFLVSSTAESALSTLCRA